MRYSYQALLNDTKKSIVESLEQFSDKLDIIPTLIDNYSVYFACVVFVLVFTRGLFPLEDNKKEIIKQTKYSIVTSLLPFFYIFFIGEIIPNVYSHIEFVIYKISLNISSVILLAGSAFLFWLGLIASYENYKNDKFKEFGKIPVEPIYLLAVWIVAISSVACTFFLLSLAFPLYWVSAVGLSSFIWIGEHLSYQLFILILIGIALYFLPSMIAKLRSHHDRLAIFFTNLLLGWTIIGWVVSIIWSGTHTKNVK